MSILFISLGFVCAWSFIALLGWSFLQTAWQGCTYLQRLHQIPCSDCTFCTGDYRLKCTVHPCQALSEDAIGCLDFEPKTTVYETLSVNRYPYNVLRK
ncbi:MAG: hypothetical protein AAGA60_26195 [Cyanobacteria bacterium P01_E01_bin.42]